jgi:hypothetical protein
VFVGNDSIEFHALKFSHVYYCPFGLQRVIKMKSLLRGILPFGHFFLDDALSSHEELQRTPDVTKSSQCLLKGSQFANLGKSRNLHGEHRLPIRPTLDLIHCMVFGSVQS